MRIDFESWYLIGAVLITAGCSPDPFLAEYAAVQKDSAASDPWSALVALDQKYPNRLALKIDLGARSWAAGNIQQAEAYWSRGEALAGTTSDALDAVLWADLAQAALARGDSAKALSYADRAVHFKDEKLGAIFTRAKAHLARHEDKQALEDFKTGWETKRSTMNAADYGAYARALIADKNYALALEVLENYRENRPYEPGTGLVESVCLENLGRYDESVLAALIDVDFQRSRGLIASEQVLQNLKTLETRISSRGLPPEKSGITSVRASAAWVQGDFNKVDFDNTLLSASADARFLRLDAQLHTGRVGDTDLKAYATLETRFHDFPSYYLGLISYFRDTRKDHRNDGFAALAERVVNLAPSGPYAAEGRAALALSWSVPADQAPSLLTKAEIDRALPGDPKLVRLLGTSDNPSVQYAVAKLQQWAAASAESRSLLTALEAISSGRVKERLNLFFRAASVLVLLVSCGAPPAKTAEAYAHAKAAYSEGKIEDALHELAGLLAGDGSFAPARLLYGRTLYFHRDYENARQVLERLAADRPDSVEASLWLVRTLIQLRKPSDAEGILVKLLAVNADDPRLAYQMGLLREARNDLRGAQDFFKSAALADEDAALVHFESARLYYQLQQNADARAELTRALAMLGPQSLLRRPMEELLAGVKP